MVGLYFLLAFPVVLLVWAVWVFNRLVRRRNLLREGWSGIDVQLRRRYNLIPNLVEVVKGYRAHEERVFTEVTAQRSRAEGASGARQQGEAERELSRGIGQLLAVAEAYPDLKAGANFLELQRQLAEVENEIQLARRYYNGAVRNFNILVESFPSTLVARAFGFPREEFFELELVTQREAPSVDFAA